MAECKFRGAIELWAKLKQRQDGTVVAWHSLVDHSADVAAVMEALLAQRTIAARLARLAGRDVLDPTTQTRLCALSFLHDIGKANRGFRARCDPQASLVGHIDQLRWVFEGSNNEDVLAALFKVLGLERLQLWFSENGEGLWHAVFAHHGRPWRNVPARAWWEPHKDSNPVGDLGPMRAALDHWFADAFQDGPALPHQPAFQHAFAGLLMLADWLGSDDASDAFPFASGASPDRIAFARQRVQILLRRIGLDAEPTRAELRAHPLDFRSTFANDPRPLQAAIIEPDALCVVLEAETGSGKTEAALWRFLHLFKHGLVDGLYFALPTRVAATQMFERVRRFRDRVFGADGPPAVIRAVPGQIGADRAEGRALPNFGFEWDDEPDNGARRARWAAEHPKRFLAAQIAIGTIDQALLAAVNVRHAHMRGAALLRHLLVVDEVHASDAYMGRLLRALLRAHTAAGGHALLLSATLGSALRADQLGTQAPGLAAAEAAEYPALSWAETGQEIRRPIQSAGAVKCVRLGVTPCIDDPQAIAERALHAAEAGAKVLVIRNTVVGAVSTAQSLEALAGAAHPALFRVCGVSTLHHGRFAANDRRLLDREVERAIGRERPEGGRVIVGTQTMEQSLDLDADLLLTDLCPVDVLLQRVGRLHRHARARPDGFAAAEVIVLAPAERDLASLIWRTRYGLGGVVYADLRIIEATWRLIERHPTWRVPEMNRMLVERATHPECLAALERELAAGHSAWTRHVADVEGGILAERNQARLGLLPRDKPFEEWRMEHGERHATRLGGADRQVALASTRGPFGAPPGALRVPYWLVEGVPPEEDIANETEAGGEIRFRLGTANFVYSRWGLALVTSSA